MTGRRQILGLKSETKRRKVGFARAIYWPWYCYKLFSSLFNGMANGVGLTAKGAIVIEED